MTDQYIPSVFLSFSAEDGEFVRLVHVNITDGLCEIFTRSFATGDELLRAMEDHVRKASMFCLFASEASLKSAWVKFEIDEARLQKLLRANFQVIVFPVSRSVDIGKAPAWMRAIWSPYLGWQPKDIARYINLKLIDDHLSPQVFGRGGHLDKAVAKYGLSLSGDGQAPNVFLVSGAPKIGRQTFARELLGRLFPQFKTFRFGPTLQLSEPTEPPRALSKAARSDRDKAFARVYLRGD